MYKTRLEEAYREKMVPELKKKFGLKNIHEVPELKKIVLNMGVSAAKDDIKFLDEAREELMLISGQFPVTTKAKQSVSNFKLRQGMPIGCKVTLRGAKMYDFLDRFFNFALPRVRDFQGVSEKGFDKQGNYAMGLKDELIFPEIDIDKVHKPKGLSITLGISGNPEQSKELLKMFGLPFRKKNK